MTVSAADQRWIAANEQRMIAAGNRRCDDCSKLVWHRQFMRRGRGGRNVCEHCMRQYTPTERGLLPCKSMPTWTGERR